MADDRTVIDALSDESKAVAINDLIMRIQELTRATSQATLNLNKIRGERAAVENTGGITGLLARSIKNSEVARARETAATAFGDLQAARLRMVNLTGSRITNFRRGRGESEVDALNRLGGLHAAYRTALGDANAAGALVGQDYIHKNEVDATAKQFILNPSGERFQEKEPDRAAEIVRNYFGGSMQKLANLGTRYFTMANPLMQRVRPLLRPGGFTTMGVLRALGPVGIAASGGFYFGKKAFNFQRSIHAGIQSLENEALFSGLDKGTLASFGAGLGAYGGSRQGAARLTGGIARTLGDMRYGGDGGSLTKLAKRYGLNIVGPDGRLADTNEIVLRIVELFKNANTMDREQLAILAADAGVSADMVRMMKDGPENFAWRLHEFDYLKSRLNTPESVAAAEASGRAYSEMGMAWDAAWQKLFSESGFAEGLSKMGSGFANAINGNEHGVLWGTARFIGQWMSSIASSAASIGSSIVRGVGGLFGADMDDYDMTSFVDMMKMKRQENEAEGSSFWAALWGGLESVGSIFTPEGPFSREMKEEYAQQVIPETVNNSNSSEVVYVQPDIKIEQNITTSEPVSEESGRRFGAAVGEQTASSVRRAMAPAVIGSEK